MEGNNLIKKGLVVAVILLFVSVSVIPSTGVNSSITGRQTIYVDDDNTAGPWNGTLEHPYQYIQDGIDNANSGDTVFVFNGTYYGKEPMIEVQVKVNKSISLTGENRTNTIIEGDSGQHAYRVVEITADWVNISGFTIQDYAPSGYGLEVYSNHTTISNNNIGPLHGRRSLGVFGCYNTVIGNKISSDGIAMQSNHTLITDNLISDSDIGIDIETGSYMNVTISGNTITYNLYGIHLVDYMGNCNISGNKFSKNWYYGIYFYSGCSGIIISNNIFTDNYYYNALYLGSLCNSNLISNNIFSNNSHGIKLFDGCKNNIISGNTFSGNSYSIELHGGCKNNIISGNTIMNDEYSGIDLRLLSISNNIIHNNFINNSKNAIFRTLSLYNKWDGNYWDEPRTLPYPIIGCLGLFIPSWVNFDWHPAQEPYDIGV